MSCNWNCWATPNDYSDCSDDEANKSLTASSNNAKVKCRVCRRRTVEDTMCSVCGKPVHERCSSITDHYSNRTYIRSCTICSTRLHTQQRRFQTWLQGKGRQKPFLKRKDWLVWVEQFHAESRERKKKEKEETTALAKKDDKDNNNDKNPKAK